MSTNDEPDFKAFVNSKTQQAKDTAEVLKTIAKLGKQVDNYGKKYGQTSSGDGTKPSNGAVKWVSEAVTEKAVREVGKKNIAGMTGSEVIEKIKTGQSTEVLKKLAEDPRYKGYADKASELLAGFMKPPSPPHNPQGDKD